MPQSTPQHQPTHLARQTSRSGASPEMEALSRLTGLTAQTAIQRSSTVLLFLQQQDAGQQVET
jgi:hypothetical protein